MITIDQSPGSVVVVCSCGWRDVFTGLGPAHTAASTHASSHHLAVTAKRHNELATRARARQRG
jgi:hypothetical protein